jgi:peroxiredoxin
MKTKIIFCISLSILCFSFIQGQTNQIKPPALGERFPNFTLPVYQGGEFTMAHMRGKNVLLIALRGKYAEDHWCAICNYQYADFASLATADSIREKYNLSIVFLMTYAKDVLTVWENAFPQEMKKIENWKYPANIENQTTDQKNWSVYTRQKFPKTFTFPHEKVELPLPILMDEKHELLKGLDIFRMEWDGGKVAQNIPTVYIIDTEGILRFKYISQNTLDRPTSEYILTFIRKMVLPK